MPKMLRGDTSQAGDKNIYDDHWVARCKLDFSTTTILANADKYTVERMEVLKPLKLKRGK